MYNDKLAEPAEVRSVCREVLGPLPNGTSVLQFCFTLQCAFYQAQLIILEKTLNQNYQSFFGCLSHMMRIDLASFVLKSEHVNRCAMRYFTL